MPHLTVTLKTIAESWLLTVALIAAGLAIGPLLPSGPYVHGPGLAGQIIALDGVFYRSIATTGYHWNPALGTQLGHGENLAFFPAFPLILAALARLTPLTPALNAAASLILGLAGTAAFARLAKRISPPKQARLATLCFAAWPAITFFVMGYPAGLINLCAANCLFHAIQRRPLRAALWCGLGTAAAPQLVFIALAFCLDLARPWLKTRPTPRAALTTIATGALSIWGLLAFMAYQEVTFHDPFAFLAAQHGFAELPSVLPHLRRLVSPAWYLFPLTYTHLAFTLALHHAGAPDRLRQNFVLAAQLLLTLLTIILAAAGIVRAATTARHPIIPLASFCLLLGYLWYVATGTFQMLCGPRMLFPAFALFLLLGATPRPRALLVFLSALSIASTAVIAAGYGII
jgi:hypothetical protein